MTSQRYLCTAATVLAVSISLTACETAPVTGRNQLILLPEDQAVAMGADAFRQIRSKTPVSKDTRLNRMVERVGRRIVKVAQGPGYNWSFTVFQDESPNAFALPGGKVGVNTGMFKVAKTESQLAAVIAHEIAHAVARHSSERLSRQIALQGGLAVAGAASQTAAQYSQILAQAATLGVVLPFTRTQEAEADEIGVIYMARAGYDPRAAIKLWQNFARQGGDRPPEFLSTHPSPDNRIKRLQQIMPKALEIYRRNRR